MTNTSTASPAGPQAWRLAELPLHKLIASGRKVSPQSCARVVRIAVLGDAATQHYCQALAAMMKLRGVWPELYEAEFDMIRQEVLDPGSGLNEFQPQFVILFNVVQALESRFIAASNKARFAEDAVGAGVRR